jgi:cation:H+ antiporter
VELDLPPMPVIKSVAMVIIGLAGLTLGGHWIVTGSIKIAAQFGLSEAMIGLTVVALGTSLPELATSMVAAYKKNMDIAVGNVIGSNIFNLFFVLGISAVIKPLPFYEASMADTGMTIFSNILLFGLVFIGRKHILQRWQGTVFVLIYFLYMTYVIIRG